jgi:hypothetical protein
MTDKPYANVTTLDDFITQVMARWDRRWDTRQISREMCIPESEVARALRIGRERRRAEA